MRLVASVLAASIALSSFTAPVFASSESDAKDLFARARELRQKGDCASAIPLFQKAFQLYPQGLGSLRNLAECEEQVGKFASSRRDWLELKRALIVNKDAKYEGWDADADAAAARLAPKVGRLTIEITVVGPNGDVALTTDMGLRVLVNGEAFDPKLVDLPLDRDPGTYLVRIEGGKEIVQKSIALSAGEQKTLGLKVELPASDAAAPPSKQPDPKLPPDEPRGSSSSLRTVGYVSLGVGAAAAIATGVFIAVRAGAKSDLQSHCPQYSTGFCTNPAAKDDVDRGSRAATFVNVFGAVAIVGVGLGVGLVIAGAPKEKSSAVKVAPWAGNGAGGAAVWGAF